MDKKVDMKSMNMEELVKFIEELGEKKFRAKQIYEWIHIKHVKSFEEMTNISKKFAEQLNEICTLTSLEKADVQISKMDGTRKYLFALEDGNVIESVLMRYKHGNSVCISSQVGCRMGCRFCASTLDGLVRGLTPAEMVDQIYQISKDTGERISNVVVMGTGEPLDNYDNLLRFIELLTDENGLNISQRNVTVSTCGIVPKIRELAEQKLSITLALSLHASNQKKRLELMPIANNYSLGEVLEACDYYFTKTGRRISFEYALVGGDKDTYLWILSRTPDLDEDIINLLLMKIENTDSNYENEYLEKKEIKDKKIKIEVDADKEFMIDPIMYKSRIKHLKLRCCKSA